MDVHELVSIDRDEMVGLATAEYDRLLARLRDLEASAWDRPTACDGWSVRDMTAHLLGTAEANASQRENARQSIRGLRRARATGRPLVDGINEVQIDDRRHLRADELIARLHDVAPHAVRGRRRTPGPMRYISVPGPLGDRISLVELVDVIYTRDQWMHRIDLARATGREPLLTAEHDGRIVADVVRDWALTHGQPFVLALDGVAGGSYAQGEHGPSLRLDAIDFCLAVSGRAPSDGLLAVPVTF
jgi:uncharacterized protein (TIGR03083 family)